MVGENSLSTRERPHGEERFTPGSGEMEIQNETLSKAIIEGIDNKSNITDEQVPTFENLNSYSFEKTNSISHAHFEPPIPKNGVRTQQYIDKFNTELESKISNAVDPEVVDRLFNVLGKPYEYAKQGILALESESKTHNIPQILRLKDAMDHIALALTTYAGDKKKQLSSLDMAEDCLKRVSIESIEIIVNELYSSTQEILEKPRFYYRLTFFSLPDEAKIDTHCKNIEYYLRDGQLRENMGYWESCLTAYERAYDEALTLKNLLPNIDEARYRFFVIFISIAAILISVTVPFIFHFI